jgi:hypothetical protein
VKLNRQITLGLAIPRLRPEQLIEDFSNEHAHFSICSNLFVQVGVSNMDSSSFLFSLKVIDI